MSQSSSPSTCGIVQRCFSERAIVAGRQAIFKTTGRTHRESSHAHDLGHNSSWYHEGTDGCALAVRARLPRNPDTRSSLQSGENSRVVSLSATQACMIEFTTVRWASTSLATVLSFFSLLLPDCACHDRRTTLFQGPCRGGAPAAWISGAHGWQSGYIQVWQWQAGGEVCSTAPPSGRLTDLQVQQTVPHFLFCPANQRGERRDSTHHTHTHSNRAQHTQTQSNTNAFIRFHIQ